ncbi:Uma2 family endonuclease [Nonomuraea sp. NPDC049400]|uniref:Uma2 family endonuclease n=1 Tax=Nonomuraea sp. NPDC049400 TaxID=3364352 RepID=UPI00379C6857
MATIEPTAGRAAFPSAPYTVDDLLKFPDDGNRYELFNGSLVVSPAPSLLHQDVIFFLQTILHQAAPSHVKVYSTVNVRPSDEDLYIPDLVVVSRANVKSTKVMLAPSDVLLAVEVVSPSTKMHDRGTKAVAYAAAGIPLYWRIEPFEGPTLYVYELDGDSYKEPTAHKAGTIVSLSSPYSVSFDPADLVDD